MTDWLPESIRGKAVAPPPEPVAQAPKVDPLAYSNDTPAIIRACHILHKNGSGVHFLDEIAAIAAAAVKELPDSADAWDALGTALRALNRTDEALEAYAKANDLDPQSLRIRANMGSALVDAGYVVDGIVMLEGCLKERPNFGYAFLCLSRAVMLYGDLERGWMLYSQRRRIPEFFSQVNKYPVPIWDGKRSERVILVGEEGAGEKLMYASMIREMQAAGAEVVFEANKSFARFAPLIRRSFPDIEVRVEENAPFGVQSQILSGDLPRLFRQTFKHFPKHDGYLVPDPERVAWFKNYFRSRFDDDKIVGFSWRGGDALARFKGLPLKDFAPLLRTPGVTFIDLQFGPHDQERADVAASGLPVPHRIPSLDTWEDMDGMAACMAACDEVITVSNTNAHIAGALGVKVTNVIPSQAGAMWFWFSDRSDSPWYPSMRLIRHKWGDDLSALNVDLINQVTSGTAARAA